MNIQLIIATVLAAVCFGGGWTLKSWQVGYKEKARVEQILADQRTNAACTLRGADNVIQAQNDAASREAVLRVALSGSRNAIVSLSDATAAALRDAAVSQNACLERATTLGGLLDTMAVAGGEISAKANLHASDLRKMTDAWPKQKE